jgi:hypothetical protein
MEVDVEAIASGPPKRPLRSPPFGLIVDGVVVAVKSSRHNARRCRRHSISPR